MAGLAVMLLCLAGLGLANSAGERSSVSALLNVAQTNAAHEAEAGLDPSPPDNRACPFPYPRHSLEARPHMLLLPLSPWQHHLTGLVMQEIWNGTLPYLFGGSPEPCQSCHSGDIAEFCQVLPVWPHQRAWPQPAAAR